MWTRYREVGTKGLYLLNSINAGSRYLLKRNKYFLKTFILIWRTYVRNI